MCITILLQYFFLFFNVPYLSSLQLQTCSFYKFFVHIFHFHIYPATIYTHKIITTIFRFLITPTIYTLLFILSYSFILYILVVFYHVFDIYLFANNRYFLSIPIFISYIYHKSPVLAAAPDNL